MDLDLPSQLNDNDFNVRHKALDDVSDEKILIEVATNDLDDYVRYKAFLKLRDYYPDSFMLFSPEFILQCSDEILLTFIVKDSMYSSPKIACGRPIDKDVFVQYLVLYDDRSNIRACAVENPNLRDENLLKEVVLYDYNHRVRQAALRNPNLNIQPLFELMVGHDSDDGVRFEATRRLDDEDVLTDIAVNDPKASIRSAAVNNPHLYNERILIKAALNDVVDYVRQGAIHKITNEIVLSRIARQDESKVVRLDAKNRLKEINPRSVYLIEDPLFAGDNDLIKVAKDAINLHSRIAAIKEIKDSSVLKDFALNDSKWRVRQAAAQNTCLVESQILASLALNDSSPRVRKAAFLNPNFNDTNALEKISLNDTNESNRYFALKKLEMIK